MCIALSSFLILDRLSVSHPDHILRQEILKLNKVWCKSCELVAKFTIIQLFFFQFLRHQESIAFEGYQLRLGCETGFYIKEVNFYLPITDHNIHSLHSFCYLVVQTFYLMYLTRKNCFQTPFFESPGGGEIRQVFRNGLLLISIFFIKLGFDKHKNERFSFLRKIQIVPKMGQIGHFWAHNQHF